MFALMSAKTVKRIFRKTSLDLWFCFNFRCLNYTKHIDVKLTKNNGCEKRSLL